MRALPAEESGIVREEYHDGRRIKYIEEPHYVPSSHRNPYHHNEEFISPPLKVVDLDSLDDTEIHDPDLDSDEAPRVLVVKNQTESEPNTARPPVGNHHTHSPDWNRLHPTKKVEEVFDIIPDFKPPVIPPSPANWTVGLLQCPFKHIYLKNSVDSVQKKGKRKYV